MRRFPIALLAAILIAGASAPAQTIEMRSGPFTIFSDGTTVTVDVASNALQEFKVHGPSRIQYTAKQVVLTLGEPGPGPIPTPPTPKPVDPVVAWGPLDKIIILDESSKRTGKEVYFDPAVAPALTETAAKGPDGAPNWFIWDKDVKLAAKFEAWADSLAKAKGDYISSNPPRSGPVLYAFDAQGRMAEPKPLDGLTPAQAVSAITSLKK